MTYGWAFSPSLEDLRKQAVTETQKAALAQALQYPNPYGMDPSPHPIRRGGHLSSGSRMDLRTQAAVFDLAADRGKRPSTEAYAKKHQVPVDRVRIAWKQYRQRDRVLTETQEVLLCKRLDRLTRYGGKAKAAEDPCPAKKLVCEYACGVLADTEDLDSGVTNRWSMKRGWVEEFFSRHPEYDVAADSGPSAPPTRHPFTHARELWLLGEEKQTLIKMMRKYLHLRECLHEDDDYWKAVKKAFKKQTGYRFWWLGDRNEIEFSQASQYKPWYDSDWELREDLTVGKRQRDQDGLDTIPRIVLGAAFTNMLFARTEAEADVDFERRSPPPGLTKPESMYFANDFDSDIWRCINGAANWIREAGVRYHEADCWYGCMADQSYYVHRRCAYDRISLGG